MSIGTHAGFWDRIADGYAKKPVPDEAIYQKKLRATREYFRTDSAVFEFGCGTGSTALAHAPYVKRIDAIDISPRMIEIARRKAKADGVGNVAFEAATIEAFQAPDETYDVVLGLSILHLVADKEAVIAKVRRMLKPGGVFVTSTVCLGENMKFFKYVGPIGAALGLMPMVKVFTGDELVEGFTQQGFTIDYDWRPTKSRAVFVIAKKTD